MGSTVASASLVGIFAAMAGVFLLRRRTPKIIELAMWTGLVAVCFLTITRSPDAQARALTGAVVWAVGQMVGTVAGGFGHGVFKWTDHSRFVISHWVVLLFGADLLALALVTARRQADGWQPAVKLRDWMEMPRTARRKPAPTTAVEDINRRLRAWASVAAGTVLNRTTPVRARLRDVPILRAARGSRTPAAEVGIITSTSADLGGAPTFLAPVESGIAGKAAATHSVMPSTRKPRARAVLDSTGAVAPARSRRSEGMGKRVSRKRDRSSRLAS